MLTFSAVGFRQGKRRGKDFIFDRFISTQYVFDGAFTLWIMLVKMKLETYDINKKINRL